MNPSNTDPLTLSKAPPHLVENKLARKTWTATLFGVVQVSAFLYWFYWAYCQYIKWYSYKQGTYVLSAGEAPPTLPETGIVKVGIPLFLISIFVEFLLSHILGEHENYRAAETVSNFSNGILQQMTEMWTEMFGQWLGITMITAIPYRYIYENYGLTRALEGNWMGFVFMWFARDFGYYWFHRAAHRSAFMWAVHGVHHIPNEFNYSVNISQGALQRLTSALFYAPLALFCPPEIYAIIFPMEKIYGFFTHTRLVSKMYFISNFFVTPSTHRVHHAGAPSKYIDKNYGEMLTIWDHMFGTHQEEEEPVVFGHVHPFDSWNPVDAQLTVWKGIVAKTKLCNNFVDKFLCFVLPPGWDPLSPVEYPLVDSTPYSALKYDSKLPWILTLFLLVWFSASLSLGIALVRLTGSLTLFANAVIFFYVLYSLFSLGSLSNLNPRSVFYEILRMTLAPVIVCFVMNQFGFDFREILNKTVITIFVSLISIFILISHGQLFVEETKEQRDKRVWIREAGRAFTEALENAQNAHKKDTTKSEKSNGVLDHDEPAESQKTRSSRSPKASVASPQKRAPAPGSPRGRKKKLA